MSLSSQLERYASQAASSATAIAAHLRALPAEPATLEGDMPAAPAIAAARLQLAEAAFELLNLSRAPGEVLTDLTADVCKLTPPPPPGTAGHEADG